MINEQKLNSSMNLLERMGDIKSKISPFGGLRLLSEANLNHIMKNAEQNGIIIISANRDSIESDVPNADLSSQYNSFLQENNLTDSEELRDKWLTNRNKQAYKSLYDVVRKSNYSYSQVYGGFKGTDNVTAKYEPLFLIYSVDRQGNQLPFDELFELGKKLCLDFKQESFFAQAPGQAPNYYGADGEKQNATSSKFVKFNRENEPYFTTAKKEKGDNAQRFTSDIIFEHYAKEFGIDYINRIQRTQNGETLLI